MTNQNGALYKIPVDTSEAQEKIGKLAKQTVGTFKDMYGSLSKQDEALMEQRAKNLLSLAVKEQQTADRIKANWGKLGKEMGQMFGFAGKELTDFMGEFDRMMKTMAPKLARQTSHVHNEMVQAAVRSQRDAVLQSQKYLNAFATQKKQLMDGLVKTRAEEQRLSQQSGKASVGLVDAYAKNMSASLMKHNRDVVSNVERTLKEIKSKQDKAETQLAAKTKEGAGANVIKGINAQIEAYNKLRTQMQGVMSMQRNLEKEILDTDYGTEGIEKMVDHWERYYKMQEEYEKRQDTFRKKNKGVMTMQAEAKVEEQYRRQAEAQAERGLMSTTRQQVRTDVRSSRSKADLEAVYKRAEQLDKEYAAKNHGRTLNAAAAYADALSEEMAMRNKANQSTMARQIDMTKNLMKQANVEIEREMEKAKDKRSEDVINNAKQRRSELDAYLKRLFAYNQAQENLNAGMRTGRVDHQRGFLALNNLSKSFGEDRNRVKDAQDRYAVQQVGQKTFDKTSLDNEHLDVRIRKALDTGTAQLDEFYRKAHKAQEAMSALADEVAEMETGSDKAFQLNKLDQYENKLEAIQDDLSLLYQQLNRLATSDTSLNFAQAQADVNQVRQGLGDKLKDIGYYMGISNDHVQDVLKLETKREAAAERVSDTQEEINTKFRALQVLEKEILRLESQRHSMTSQQQLDLDRSRKTYDEIFNTLKHIRGIDPTSFLGIDNIKQLDEDVDKAERAFGQFDQQVKNLKVDMNLLNASFRQDKASYQQFTKLSNVLDGAEKNMKRLVDLQKDLTTGSRAGEMSSGGLKNLDSDIVALRTELSNLWRFASDLSTDMASGVTKSTEAALANLGNMASRFKSTVETSASLAEEEIRDTKEVMDHASRFLKLETGTQDRDTALKKKLENLQLSLKQQRDTTDRHATTLNGPDLQKTNDALLDQETRLKHIHDLLERIQKFDHDTLGMAASKQMGPTGLKNREAQSGLMRSDLGSQLADLQTDNKGTGQDLGRMVSDATKLEDRLQETLSTVRTAGQSFKQIQGIMADIQRYKFPVYEAAGNERLKESKRLMEQIDQLSADIQHGIMNSLSPEQIKPMQNEMKDLISQVRVLAGDMQNLRRGDIGVSSVNGGLSMEKAIQGIKEQQKVFRDMVHTMTDGARTMMYEFVGAFIVIEQAMQRPLQAFAEFDSEIRKFSAVTFDDRLGIDSATQAADNFSKVARQLALDSKFTATSIAQAAVEMGRMGFTAEDTAASMETIMNAAAATGEKIATVGEVTAGVRNAYHMDIADMAHITDVLSQVLVRSPAQMEDLAVAFKYIGSVGHSAGQELEDTSAILTVLHNNMIMGSTAGTNMRQALLRLVNLSPEASQMLRTLGVNVKNDTGEFRQMTDIMVDLAGSLSGVTESTRTMALESLFGERAVSGMLAVVNEINEKGPSAFLALRQSFNTVDGLTDKMKKISFAGLQAEIDKFKASFSEFKIAFGEAFAPFLVFAMDTIKTIMTNFQGLSTEFKTTLGTMASLGLVASALGAGFSALTFGVGSFARALIESRKVWSSVSDHMAAAGGLMQFFSQSWSQLGVNVTAALPTLNAAGQAIASTGNLTAQAALAADGAAIGFRGAAMAMLPLIGTATLIVALIAALGVALYNYNEFLRETELRQTNFNEIQAITSVGLQELTRGTKDATKAETGFAFKLDETTAALYRKSHGYRKMINDYQEQIRLAEKLKKSGLDKGLDWVGTVGGKDAMMNTLRGRDDFSEEEISKLNQSGMLDQLNEKGSGYLNEMISAYSQLIPFLEKEWDLKQKDAAASRKKSEATQKYAYLQQSYYSEYQAWINETDKYLKGAHETEMNRLELQYVTHLQYMVDEGYIKGELAEQAKTDLKEYAEARDKSDTAILDNLRKQKEGQEAITQLMELELNLRQSIADLEAAQMELGFLGYQVEGMEELVRLQQESLNMIQSGQAMVDGMGDTAIYNQGYSDSEGLFRAILGGKLYPGRGAGPRGAHGHGYDAKDLAAPEGSPVYAAQSGKVNFANWQNPNNHKEGYGQQVVMDHGSGYGSRYAHLSKFAVQPGQYVQKGQVVGYVGSTGSSSGPHLHYETLLNGQPVTNNDKAAYMLANLNAMKAPAGYSGPGKANRAVHGPELPPTMAAERKRTADQEAQAERQRLLQQWQVRQRNMGLSPDAGQISDIRQKLMGAHKAIPKTGGKPHEKAQEALDDKQFASQLESRLASHYRDGARADGLMQKMDMMSQNPYFRAMRMAPDSDEFKDFEKQERAKDPQKDVIGDINKFRADYLQTAAQYNQSLVGLAREQEKIGMDIQQKQINRDKVTAEETAKHLAEVRRLRLENLEGILTDAKRTRTKMDDLEAEYALSVERRLQEHNQLKEDDPKKYAKHKVELEKDLAQDLEDIRLDYLQNKEEVDHEEIQHAKELQLQLAQIRAQTAEDLYKQEQLALDAQQAQRRKGLEDQLRNETKGYEKLSETEMAAYAEHKNKRPKLENELKYAQRMGNQTEVERIRALIHANEEAIKGYERRGNMANQATIKQIQAENKLLEVREQLELQEAQAFDRFTRQQAKRDHAMAKLQAEAERTIQLFEKMKEMFGTTSLGSAYTEASDAMKVHPAFETNIKDALEVERVLKGKSLTRDMTGGDMDAMANQAMNEYGALQDINKQNRSLRDGRAYDYKEANDALAELESKDRKAKEAGGPELTPDQEQRRRELQSKKLEAQIQLNQLDDEYYANQVKMVELRKLHNKLSDEEFQKLVKMMGIVGKVGNGLTLAVQGGGMLADALGKIDNLVVKESGQVLGKFAEFLGDGANIVTGTMRAMKGDVSGAMAALQGALNIFVNAINYLFPGDESKRKLANAQYQASKSGTEARRAELDGMRQRGEISDDQYYTELIKVAGQEGSDSVKNIQAQRGFDERIRKGEGLKQNGLYNASDEELAAYYDEASGNKSIPNQLASRFGMGMMNIPGQMLLSKVQGAGKRHFMDDVKMNRAQYEQAQKDYDKAEFEAQTQEAAKINQAISGLVRSKGNRQFLLAGGSADIKTRRGTLDGNVAQYYEGREQQATADHDKANSDAISDFLATGGIMYDFEGKITEAGQTFVNALASSTLALEENRRAIDQEKRERTATLGNMADQNALASIDNERGTNVFDRQLRVIDIQERMAKRDLQLQYDNETDPEKKELLRQQMLELPNGFENQRKEVGLERAAYGRSLKTRLAAADASLTGDPVAMAQAEGQASLDALKDQYRQDKLNPQADLKKIKEVYQRERSKQIRDNKITEMEAEKGLADAHRALENQKAANTFDTLDDIETAHRTTYAEIEDQREIDLAKFKGNAKERTRVNEEANQKMLAADLSRFEALATYYQEILKLESETKGLLAQAQNNPLAAFWADYEGKIQETMLEADKLNEMLIHAQTQGNAKDIEKIQKLQAKNEAARKAIEAVATEQLGQSTMARYKQLEDAIQASVDRDTRQWRFMIERNQTEIDRLQRVIAQLNDQKQEIEEQLDKDLSKFGFQDRTQFATALSGISLPAELMDALEYISNPSLNKASDAGAEAMVDAIETKTDYLLSVAESKRVMEELSTGGEATYQGFVAQGLDDNTLEIERQKLLLDEYAAAQQNAYLLRAKAAQAAVGLLSGEHQEELTDLRAEGKNENEIRIVEKRQMQERQRLIDLLQQSYKGYQDSVRDQLEGTAAFEKAKIDEKVKLNEGAVDDLVDKNRDLADKIADVQATADEKFLKIKEATEGIREATTRWGFSLDDVKTKFTSLMSSIKTEYEALTQKLGQPISVGIKLPGVGDSGTGTTKPKSTTPVKGPNDKYFSNSLKRWFPDMKALRAAESGNGGWAATASRSQNDLGPKSSDDAWGRSAASGSVNDYDKNGNTRTTAAAYAKYAKGKGFWQAPQLSTNARDDRVPAMISSREIVAPYPEFNRMVSRLVNTMPPGLRASGSGVGGPQTYQFAIGTVYGDIDLDRVIKQAIHQANMEAGRKNAFNLVDNN